MRIPSQRALEVAFPGKGKVLRRLLTSKSAVLAHPAAVARLAECYHPPGLGDLRMHAIDAELETCGVEFIPAGHNFKSPAIDYCNTGDTYDTTILRVHDRNPVRYVIGCWGDFVERGNYD